MTSNLEILIDAGPIMKDILHQLNEKTSMEF